MNTTVFANPFTIFMLVAGFTIGILNVHELQPPIIEGTIMLMGPIIFFYGIGVMISSIRSIRE